MNNDSIVVIGKRWNDSFGNTYHSCKAIVNNEVIDFVPFTYGYDDHYKQTAFAILQNHGYFTDQEYWQFTRNDNVIFEVSDVSRKKDL